MDKSNEFNYFLRNEDSNSRILSDNGYEPHLLKIFKKLIKTRDNRFRREYWNPYTYFI